MQPYSKYETTGPLQFLGALSQATPSITPSNFQSLGKSPPKIFGRKIDSPTLFVVNDAVDDKTDLLEFTPGAPDLNKTNKILCRKPLDLNKKAGGGLLKDNNCTI